MNISKIIARADKAGRHWSLSVEKDGAHVFRADTTTGEGDARAEVETLDPAALDAISKARPDYSLVVKGWIARLSVQMGDTLFFDCRRYKLPVRNCEIGF